MTEQEIKDYIASVRWQTSKDGSHSYTLMKWMPDLSERFYTFAQFIRDNGYPAYFYRKSYTCFDVDGHRYWTMGFPLEETILINRAENLPGDPHRNTDYPTNKIGSPK